MRIVPTTLALVLIAGLVAHAQAPAPGAPAPQTPTTQQPGTQPPGTQPPGTQPPATQVPQIPVPGALPGPIPVTPPTPLLQARAFTANTGLLFNAVRPERVLDFETAIGYLQKALESSTDPAVRAQAGGWKIYKAIEPGPNATVLYVFVIDPVAPGADYGLGRILADAYPEKIMEIWKLYTTSLAGGGSLLNLVPIVDGKPVLPTPLAPAGVTPAPTGVIPPPTTPPATTPPGTVPPATPPPGTVPPATTPPTTTPAPPGP
jgi:hypothetical protein